MIDPDVGGFFYLVSLAYSWSGMEILTDSQSIAIIRQNLLNAQVPDDYIRSFLDHTTGYQHQPSLTQFPLPESKLTFQIPPTQH